MADLLFLPPADLREAVLATGAYARALELYPSAQVRVACSADAAGLYRAAPRLAGISVWPATPGGWLSVWRGLAGARYEAAIDLRGSPVLCAALGVARVTSPQRRGMRGSRLEQWSEALGAEHPSVARLWFDKEASGKAAQWIGGAPLIALAPGASDPRGVWPAERFAAVARRLTAVLPGARVALLGDAGSAAHSRAINLSLNADGVPTQDLTGRLDMAEVAAVAAGSALCLGGDGPFMHAAAASGAPTLALYGLTDERVLGPSGARARTLRGRPFEEVLAMAETASQRGSLLEDVSIDTVEAAALELLRAGGL
jgi:ADP-heptose:LPS heptosyltransferase